MENQGIIGSSKQNRRKARMFFWPELNGKGKPGWDLHHKDPTLKYKDPVRYHEWRLEDLVPMARSDHHILHSKLNWSSPGFREKVTTKISQALMGNCPSEESREKNRKAHLGKKMSLDFAAKQKILQKEIQNRPEISRRKSEAFKGRYWWTNGNDMKRSKECPGEGWIKGRRPGITNSDKIKGCHWWINGDEQKYQKECPGEGWIRGRRKLKKNKV